MIKRILKTSTLAICLLLTVTTTQTVLASEKHSSSGNSRKSGQDWFTSTDRDQNGSLSMEEFSAMPGPRMKERSDEIFRQIDQNGDGKLQAEEFAKMREAHEAKRQEHLRNADKDADGKLSFGEFQALEQDRESKADHKPFEHMDANQDGLIQLSEFQKTATGEHAPPPPPEASQGRDFDKTDAPPPPPPRGECEHGMQDDEPNMQPPPHRVHFGPERNDRDQSRHAQERNMDKPSHNRPNPEEWFRDCDTDGNGVLDKAELQAHHDTMLQKAFVSMDANQDNYLQFDEVKPMHGPRMHPRGLMEDLGQSKDASSLDSDFGLATIDDANPKEIGPRFQLNDNYPNPFNASTNIQYEIPAASHVLLTVYNLAGEKVGTLVDEEQPAGQYQVNLDMSGQTSGTYFYRLQAGSMEIVNRMTYIK